MNDDTAIGDPVRTRPVRGSSAKKRSSAGFDDGTKGFLHIFGHLDFVIAPLPVEAQHRNTPLIDRVRSDIEITVLVWNHLAASFEADKGSIHAAALLLQARAVALELV